jgi:hypothetical protein
VATALSTQGMSPSSLSYDYTNSRDLDKELIPRIIVWIKLTFDDFVALGLWRDESY